MKNNNENNFLTIFFFIKIIILIQNAFKKLLTFNIKHFINFNKILIFFNQSKYIKL